MRVSCDACRDRIRESGSLRSQGLKNHAVTMFEVGKLSDESLDSFLAELEKVGRACTSRGKTSAVLFLSSGNSVEMSEWSAGFTLWLVLSPSANFTENWLNENVEFWPIFANFTKIRAEIGSLRPIWLN